MSIIQAIRRCFHRDSNQTPDTLPSLVRSQSQFQDLMEYERLRADRTDAHFTIVAFILDGCGQQKESLRSLALVLLDRVRRTDIIGRFDDNQNLAIILPDTNQSGAQIVGNDVAKTLRVQGTSVQVRIYPYPSSSGTDNDVSSEANLHSSSTPASLGRIKGSKESLNNSGKVYFQPRPTPHWKRVFDVTIAGVAILLASPLLAVVAVAIRITSPGPALFAQRRVGLGGRIFTIYKFRTMSVNAEAAKQQLRTLNEQDGPAFKITNDPRVTWLGRILRKACIDELPQLWNVVMGDMSIVGPRPLPVGESNQCQRWEQRRLDVLPGMTCIWQTRAERNVSFAEWMRMDIRYATSRSLWLDTKLLLKTFWLMARLKASH